MTLKILSTFVAASVCVLSCAGQEESFATRKTVQLDDGGTLEVLEEEADGDFYTLRYVSVVDLRDPHGVKRHAESVLELYAARQAEKSQCSRIHLEAIEFMEHEHLRARTMEFYAARNSDARWEIRD